MNVAKSTFIYAISAQKEISSAVTTVDLDCSAAHHRGEINRQNVHLICACHRDVSRSYIRECEHNTKSDECRDPLTNNQGCVI